MGWPKELLEITSHSSLMQIFKFDDSLAQHILRLVLSMEKKKKQQQRQASSMVVTIKDERDELKQMLPALAMPNSSNTILDELEGLKQKWEQEHTVKGVSFFATKEKKSPKFLILIFYKNL